MAPFGKIYSYPANPRVNRALIAADMNGLEIELAPFTMRETNLAPEFLAKFPLGKVPAFEGADGFCLTESVAIATYIAGAGPKAGQLLGTDAKTQTLISQWGHFAEGEVWTNIWPLYMMIVIKRQPMDEERFNAAIAGLERDLKYMEVVLKGGKKFLVGDSLTLADLVVTSALYIIFQKFYDAEMRKKIPNVVAYMQAFAAAPEHKKYYGELVMCETIEKP